MKAAVRVRMAAVETAAADLGAALVAAPVALADLVAVAWLKWAECGEAAVAAAVAEPRPADATT